MEQHAAVTDIEAQPVTLAHLALELNTPVDEVERELGATYVFRRGGFRCTTPFRASELIRLHARRKEDAEEAAQRAADVARAQREASRAAAIEARRNRHPQIRQFGLQTTRIEPSSGADVPAVVAMTTTSDKTFDGAPMTHRPSRMDWLTGKGDSGGTFGQVPRRKKGGAK